MKTIALRLVAAWVGMWILLIASGLICALLAPMGHGGEVIPIFAVLLFAFGAVARRRFGWRVADFAVSFAAAVVTSLFVISHFSEFTGPELLNEFNLEWLAFCSALIAIAWFGGFLTGNAMQGQSPARRTVKQRWLLGMAGLTWLLILGVAMLTGLRMNMIAGLVVLAVGIGAQVLCFGKLASRLKRQP